MDQTAIRQNRQLNPVFMEASGSYLYFKEILGMHAGLESYAGLSLTQG